MALARLDNRQARRLFLERHGLSERPASLDAVFDRLAFVQIDSINTVARAHHMIIHARMPGYRPRDLDSYMTRDRRVFEHWTHDASIVSMDHYPHWHLRFARSGKRVWNSWAEKGRGDFHPLTDKILSQITEHGPHCSADVGEGEKRGSGGWWEWHPSKTALEFLWMSGQIAVCHRKGFRKYYDLPERVIAPQHRAHRPTEAETIDWCCNQAIDRLGFATSGEVAAFFEHVTAAEAREWCTAQEKAGRLVQVEVENTDGSWRKSYARADVVQATQDAPDPTGAARILSPFDPALRDRKRAERLFGFHYRIEIYVPAPKRVYGYYVFPVMEGERLIGRIDMKADKSVLAVRKFWAEPGVSMGKGRRARIEAAVERSRRLSGAEQTSYAADWLNT